MKNVEEGNVSEFVQGELVSGGDREARLLEALCDTLSTLDLRNKLDDSMANKIKNKMSEIIDSIAV